MTSFNERKQILNKILKSVIHSMNPKVALKNAIKLTDQTLLLGKANFKLNDIGKIKVLALGKSAVPMFEGMEEACSLFQHKIVERLVISPFAQKKTPEHIKLSPYPYPDDSAEKLAQDALLFARDLKQEDLLIVLASGGVHGQLSLCPQGIDIKAKAKMLELLSKAGATHLDTNILMKHLSGFEGGTLLGNQSKTQVVILYTTDQSQESADTIAGGLFSPDASTFTQALKIIETYDLVADTPKNVMNHLRAGAEGKIPDTLKPQIGKAGAHAYCIRNPRDMVNVAARACESTGMLPQMPYPIIEYNIEDVARRYTAWIHQARSRLIQRPIILVGGGKPRLKLSGKAQGGRCQHLALLMAKPIAEDKAATFAAMASDGMDGVQDIGGAMLSTQTMQKAKEKKINPDKYIGKFDSYQFHEDLGTHISSKPTEVSLGDLHLLCLEPG